MQNASWKQKKMQVSNAFSVFPRGFQSAISSRSLVKSRNKTQVVTIFLFCSPSAIGTVQIKDQMAYFVQPGLCRVFHDPLVSFNFEGFDPQIFLNDPQKLLFTYFNPFPNKPCILRAAVKSFENTVGKGEIARNEQFLLFPQSFLPVW